MGKTTVVRVNRGSPTDRVETLGGRPKNRGVLCVSREGCRLAIAAFDGDQEDQEQDQKAEIPVSRKGHGLQEFPQQHGESGGGVAYCLGCCL